jgi:hypothetical protein
MQLAPTSIENSTVFVSSSSNRFRIWWNRKDCVWQTDIKNEGLNRVLGQPLWLYWGQAHSLIEAMTHIAITL